MNVQYYFSLILLVSVMIMSFIGYFSWKRNKIYYSVSLLPVSIYEFGYAFELLSTNIDNVKFWIKVEYLGAAFLPVVWLMFAISFNGYEGRIKKSNLMFLYIIPIITLLMNYTNDFHHLFYKNLYMNSNGIFPIVEIIKGPFYWVNIAYTYISMLIGLIIFISSYFKSVSIVRKQILILIIAWIIPWILDIVYIFEMTPFDLDLCPLAFSFSGIISSYAILNFKLLQLTPIALEKVFFNMLDGVIILDSENNMVNFNNSSKNIISELKYIKAGGKKIDKVLKDHKEILAALNNNLNNENLITIKINEKLRYFKININNIYRNNSKIIGRILIFNDVTEIELQRKKLADNLKLLKTLMDAIPNPIYSKNENGVYNHCNIAFAEFLGIQKEEIIGNTAAGVFGDDWGEVYGESDKDLMDKKETQVFEEKIMHNDGTYHDVIFNKAVVEDNYENHKGLVGIIIDITEEKKNREKINKLLKLKEVIVRIGYSINEFTNINDLLQLILDEVINCVDERSCGSVLILDEDKNLKLAVAKGYHKDEIKTFSIKLEDHKLRFNNGERINETVLFKDIDKAEGMKMLNTVDGIKIKSVINSPIIIDGNLYGFINIDSIYNNIFNEGDIELMEYMRNQASIAIAKHKLYEETLYLSRYDKLTNVFNRSYFEQLIKNNIYNDNIDNKEFLVAAFDLNDLKFANDNYGHSCGDELIKTFSRGLTSLTKDSDIIGRFGGDEFIGIFFNIDFKSLTNKLEKLLEHFKNNPIIFEDKVIVCSYSYGIVKYSEDGRDFDELLKCADERMYKYKRIIKENKRL